MPRHRPLPRKARLGPELASLWVRSTASGPYPQEDGGRLLAAEQASSWVHLTTSLVSLPMMLCARLQGPYLFLRGHRTCKGIAMGLPEWGSASVAKTCHFFARAQMATQLALVTSYR